MTITLLLILGLIPCVLADDWEDFTNNLATDLAPLITLFGERLTMQFLSESISLLDNIIFALSPLGVLTAVVSVIRICGSSSLRAFIGRAQEGPAEAEGELLPCVSESTAELFNDGGISRVFGRPRIVEVVAWEKKDPTTGEKSVKIGTLRDAVKEGAWSVKGNDLDVREIGDHTFMPELDIPNLSLNKGIKQKDRFWFYAAAIVGAVLQTGVLIYAALTVFVFADSFQVDDKPVDSYAFPLYIIGTTFLFMGMLYSAVIIRRSSKEYYFKPNMPSKLYWLQPGDQMVGDQVFNAFLAVQEGKESSMTKDLQYIKSKRVLKYDGRNVEVYSTLFLTLLGFIFQFIGERGLHASVILAQLGSTFIMSVLRTFLRTERMTTEENELMSERELVAHKQQELDSFAFLLEGAKSFNLLHSSNQYVDPSSQRLAPRLIETRKKLAAITKSSDNKEWNEMPIRKAAQRLAKTIESTMNLVSSWGVDFGKSFKFTLEFEAAPGSPKNADAQLGAYAVCIPRRGDSLAWRVDVNELEAIIGLWTWSLLKSDEQWRRPLYRMVGLDESEASQAETYLDFHKWMFRQTEAKLVSRTTVDAPRRLFGFQQDNYPLDKDILTVRTYNELEMMISQDLYIRFLDAAFSKMENLGGEVDIVTGFQSDWLAQNTRVNALVESFENSRLGSREDALLCIVPSLKRNGILPDLAGDSMNIRKRTDDMIKRGEWKETFSLLQWICQRSYGPEFDRSVYVIAYLCRRGMFQYSQLAREEALEKSCVLLKADIRMSFFENQRQPEFINWVMADHRVRWWHTFLYQLGWLFWHISANARDLKKIEPTLISMGFTGALPNPSSHYLDFDKDEVVSAVQMLQSLLTQKRADSPPASDDHESAFKMALNTGQDAFLYWIIMRLLESSEEGTEFTVMTWVLAITSKADWIIELMARYDVDIDAVCANGFHSVLTRFIEHPCNLKGLETALLNGANPDGSDKAPCRRPILLAAELGNIGALELLLRFGASLDVADDKEGFSALHYACSDNQSDIIEWLLSHGADIEVRAPEGATPLITAVRSADIGIVQLLLDQGAEVNVQDGIGRSPLYSASSSKAIDKMRLLLSRGADISAMAYDHKDALEVVRQLNFTEGIHLLEGAMGMASNPGHLNTSV